MVGREWEQSKIIKICQIPKKWDTGGCTMPASLTEKAPRKYVEIVFDKEHFWSIMANFRVFGSGSRNPRIPEIPEIQKSGNPRNPRNPRNLKIQNSRSQNLKKIRKTGKSPKTRFLFVKRGILAVPKIPRKTGNRFQKISISETRRKS